MDDVINELINLEGELQNLWSRLDGTNVNNLVVNQECLMEICKHTNRIAQLLRWQIGKD